MAIFLPEHMLTILMEKKDFTKIGDNNMLPPMNRNDGKVLSKEQRLWWARQIEESQLIICNRNELLEEWDEIMAEMPNTKEITGEDSVEPDFSHAALPFKKVFYTLNDGMNVNTMEVFPDGRKGQVDWFAECVVDEGGKYKSLSYGRLLQEGQKAWILAEEEAEHLLPLAGIITLKLNRSKTVGYEKWPIISNMKKYGLGRIKHESVIYISNDKTITSPVSKYQEIEWKTRWWVRGHWVRLKDTTLGKDRDGNRVIFGKTWRSEHERGNPDGIQKKQIRVMKPTKEMTV